jgi:hypothetical protein
MWLCAAGMLRGQSTTHLAPPDTLINSASPKPTLRQRGGEKIYTLETAYLDSLKLPDAFLFRGSVKVFFDNLSVDSIRYRIDHRNGIVYLRYLFLDTLYHRLEVRYRSLPFQLKADYARRDVMVQTDSAAKSDSLVARLRSLKPDNRIDDIFEGTALRKSGSIVRGVTVGSNQDLNINSGLRLQLDGEISKGVEISAALTDENTPIQPEGNTQTLQEFDRVFIEVKSSVAKATVGDFNIDLTGTEFGNIARRLQGGKVELMNDFGFVKTNALLGFATSRGRFQVNQFNGQDGVQGPYRLTNQNGQPFIIVLAGTERVYVDGILQVRGQNNDYIIEYGTGEVFFQPRRLITVQSRIVVDFQFTDRLYPRNFFAAKAATEWFGGKLAFQSSFIQESDDENSPIDFTLTERQRALIASAGGNRLAAFDTAGFVGFDRQGRPAGSYVRVDTLIGAQTVSVFRFAGQGAPNAFWNPPFSLVGQGLGNYNRISFGIFEYVGDGAGAYLPIVLLPIPTAQSVVDLTLKFNPTPAFKIELEGAASQNDLNKFSTIDDSLRRGTAYKVALQFAPTQVKLFGKNFGDFRLDASQRLTDRQFVFIDRTLPVEFGRNFNLIDFNGNSLFTLPTSELIRNASVNYKPVKFALFTYTFGNLERDTLFTALRHEVDIQIRKDSLTTTNYNVAYTNSRNTQSLENARWVRQLGRTEWDIFFGKRFSITPFFLMELNSKRTRSLTTDTLRNDSFDILDVTQGLRFPVIFGQTLTSSFGYRTDNLFDSPSPFGATLIPASVARTLALDWRLLPRESILAQFSFTNRLRTFSERFRELGNINNETFLLRLQTRYTPFRGGIEAEWLYDVATERAARQERVFIIVPLGRGNYIWRDRNRNGLKEFDEFIPASFIGDVGDDTLQYTLRTFPSDRLFPIVDLKTSWRLRFRPNRIITDRNTPAKALLTTLSSETLVRVEERSTEPDIKQIYLLNASKFLNDSTTLAGNFTVQQDVFLWENELTNLRFRFQQRVSQNQFSLGIEKRLYAERSLRLVTRFGYELGFELNLISSYNRAFTAGLADVNVIATGRQFQIGATSITPDISYRPIQDLEFGLRGSLEERSDEFPVQAFGRLVAQAQINSAQLRSIYSFRGKGRVSAQFERLQTVVRDAALQDIQFELTNGNAIGTTWIWRLDFDYRLSNYITASGGYDGRTLPIGRTIHTGRAEVRAVF